MLLKKIMIRREEHKKNPARSSPARSNPTTYLSSAPISCSCSQLLLLGKSTKRMGGQVWQKHAMNIRSANLLYLKKFKHKFKDQPFFNMKGVCSFHPPSVLIFYIYSRIYFLLLLIIWNTTSLTLYPILEVNLFINIPFLFLTLLCCIVLFFLQTAKSCSWHARYTVLTYLQTMVFYNLFIFLNNEEAVDDIRWLVIQLLEDEQLEVNKYLLLALLVSPCKMYVWE